MLQQPCDKVVICHNI